MPFAEIVVNSPASRSNRGYDYHIPPGLEVNVGHLVLIPFGPRQMQGIVVALLETSDIEDTRDIIAIVDPRPVLTQFQVQLAQWIAEYYHCPIADAVRLMLPSSIQQRCMSTIEARSDIVLPGNMTDRQNNLLAFLQQRGRTRLDKAKSNLSIPSFSSVVSQLVRKGIVVRGWELEKPRVQPRIEKRVRLSSEYKDMDTLLSEVRYAPQQRIVLEYLLNTLDSKDGSKTDETGVSVERLRDDTGCTLPVLKALISKGLIEIEERQVWRDPLARRVFSTPSNTTLTPAQQDAWAMIEPDLQSPSHNAYLLHGVTGSGKTEIYLRALEQTLRLGKQGIILVPEIALTPQTVHRFASHFPGRVAIWHSRLSPGERYDEWRRIRDGALDIIIGSRSAVFTPVQQPGIIIVDEEHEWSYKHEKTPRYHARDVAIKLSELAGAKVILGSATPDVVTYHRAKTGKYRLVELRERVEGSEGEGEGTQSAAPLALMPPVHIVDLRQELRAGNRGIFSRALIEAIDSTLSVREQVILFLNRRGASTFIICRDCGHVLLCKRCDVPLSYHSAEDDLVCHQCNYQTFTPSRCPNCMSSRIKFFGSGTQKVEEETKRLFPKARVLRWDSDTVSSQLPHEQILTRFKEHEADILVGTQMVAKGLDLPGVTLVGVVSADTILHLPDFRAGERTFQLLTQVAGRAGRGPLGGRVIIQTYSPEHYCIQTASRHDYFRFYQQEIEFREKHGYPPFGKLVKLVYHQSNDARCQQEAERLAEILRQNVERLGLPGIEVIGPAPAYKRRIRGKHRWQIIIRGGQTSELIENTPITYGWTVDVDPLTTL